MLFLISRLISVTNSNEALLMNNQQTEKEKQAKERELKKLRSLANTKEEPATTLDEMKIIKDINYQLMEALFAYESLDERDQQITPYLIEETKNNMTRCKSDYDQNDTSSLLLSSEAFFAKLFNSNEINVINYVVSELTFNKEAQKQHMYVKVKYVKDTGQWQAKSFNFSKYVEG
ncbi:hypothetical protein [Brochothrix thermosphacta]|uniref:hypothetical protein n=2 Tax=Brochothrix thermosphacta TaxID=2756 RepID=UPI0004903661|nr:hypothetical protein [Brochothrix thermosphacta]ODJ51550.1 hypothetical protein BFR34_00590 [Brochothrix thermosphacta DSM 20171 = FSL F6-1036]